MEMSPLFMKNSIYGRIHSAQYADFFLDTHPKPITINFTK
jgi:hypothetical protein